MYEKVVWERVDPKKKINKKLDNEVEQHIKPRGKKLLLFM